MTPRWVARLLTLGVLVVLVGCGRPAHFGIVFASNRDGHFEDIYRMTSDGRNVERLTDTPDEAEMGPRVSPDGRSILFSRGAARLAREIYRLDVASGATLQLTDSPYYDEGAVWSPDGSRIAFTSDRDGGYMLLYMMDPDGSNQRHIPLVTDPSGMGHISWSPDGQYLVYVSDYPAESPALTSFLFIVDLSTLEATRLTNERHGFCLFPDWSPDGEWIAMVCTQGTEAGDIGEVYVIRPDGSGWRQVTKRPPELDSYYSAYDPLVLYVREPRWSPDGTEIVYAANGIGQPWNIYIIGANGKNNRRLTDHDAADWDLSTYRLP
jgi:Tol biopolymer transport system component